MGNQELKKLQTNTPILSTNRPSHPHHNTNDLLLLSRVVLDPRIQFRNQSHANQIKFQQKPKELDPKTCCDITSLSISNKDLDISDVSCPVCYQIYESPRVMKCGHTFCSSCIQDWGKRKNTTCPYCRTQLKKIKGNFGNIDRRTLKKIDRLIIKCKNCNWKGSSYLYMSVFQKKPYLDDEQIPCQKIKQQQDSKLEQIEQIEEQNKFDSLERRQTSIYQNLDFQLGQQKLQEQYKSNKKSQNQMISKKSIVSARDPQKMIAIFQNQEIPPLNSFSSNQQPQGNTWKWDDMILDDSDLF